jgi:hypothetical protein
MMGKKAYEDWRKENGWLKLSELDSNERAVALAATSRLHQPHYLYKVTLENPDGPDWFVQIATYDKHFKGQFAAYSVEDHRRRWRVRGSERYDRWITVPKDKRRG